MPTSNQPVRNPAPSIQDFLDAMQFAEGLIGNKLNLCDAQVKTKDGIFVDVSRFMLVFSSKYFAKRYLRNGKGPLLDIDSLQMPMSNDIFQVALKFLYSKSSDFITTVQNLETANTGNLHDICCKLTLLTHAAAFLRSQHLFDLCASTMSDFTGKFPSMVCTALETMNTDGHQIFDKDDKKLVPIRHGLLSIISYNPQTSLLLHSGESQTQTSSETRGILQLSADSLRSVLKVISKEPEFAIRSIFFWGTKGIPLNEDTKEALNNPSNNLRSRVLEAKQFIKRLPLQNLDPEFVSSFICDTNIVDKSMTLQLSSSALKRTLSEFSKAKKKLRLAKERNSQARTTGRDSNS